MLVIYRITRDRSQEGNFYEGYIARNVTSDATDDAIQANIIKVGYKSLGIPSVQ